MADELDELEAEFDELMDDESEKIMRNYREMKIAQAQFEYQEQQENMTQGHGTYVEIVESEFLPVVTKSRFAVVAFFHKDFERCKIVDMHLFKICKMHPECRFVRLDAERAPFFIQRLGIQMLPTIITFIDGVTSDRIIGFEELGGEDDFPTITLTRRLVNAGVLKPKGRKEKGTMKVRRGRQEESSSGDEY